VVLVATLQALEALAVAIVVVGLTRKVSVLGTSIRRTRVGGVPSVDTRAKGNRVRQAEFECESCGATANADSVGGKYVGWRYICRGLQSSRRAGDSQLALKSGIVTPNRGFVPSD